MAEVLVYTAVFGGYDVLEPPVVPGMFRAYTDGEPIPGWNTWPTDPMYGPQKTARFLKCLTPSQNETTIWVDGNVQLLIPPEDLAAAWLGEEYDIALFRHPGHDCIYEEAQVCKSKHKDGASIIDVQMADYRAAGFPEHYGLGETAVLARRSSNVVAEFNARWWAEILTGSVRDQLSFDFVRWSMGKRVRVNLVDGGPGWRRREHPWFRCVRHVGG